jgi:protein subunit release factor B
MVGQDKLNALEARLKKLNISQKDLVIKAILGSGSGGQKVNKTHSTIYVKHLPTGFEVKCGRTRSQELNRYYALQLLCEKLEKKLFDIQTKKEKEAAKIRRQKKRRSRKAQQKVLEEKKQHSVKKVLRQKPQTND